MFDQAKAEQVIERVWQGQSLRSAAKDVGVKHNTFLDWAAENPPIADQYARAVSERGSVHAERIERVVDQVEEGELAPDQARVMVDALKWTASKLDPKRYGDQLNVKHSGGVTFAVNVIAPTLATIAPKPALEHDADRGE